jgi:iterative type I PKS product template protein
MVVEEPPKRILSGDDPRSHHVVVLSAKELSSLQGNQQRLHDFLVAYPDVRLEDIAYTTTARRAHHPLRSSFCISSTTELRQALTSQMVSTLDQASGPQKAQAYMVFAFPGQGFKFCGLAKTLYYTCKQFQQTLMELDQICQSFKLPTFINFVLDDNLGDASFLSPVQSHLSIVAVEIALARLLQVWGLVPSAVIGHSLGEYAALCIAGVLTIADTLLLVGRRAQLMEELCTINTHGMLVVKSSSEQLRKLVEVENGDPFAISCFNSSSSIVVNGPTRDLQRLQTTLKEIHLIKSTYISVPYAFHSSQLDTMLEAYRQVALCATFSKPSVQVASTLLGKIVDDDITFTASYLVNQTRQPVQFEAAIKSLESVGIITGKTLLVETGPGSMCLSMARANLSEPCALIPCLQSTDSNWEKLSKVVADAYVAGFSVNWSEYHKQYKSSLSVVDLPLYHFNLRNFWIQYKGGVATLANEVTALKQQVAIMAARPELEAVEVPPVSTSLHRVMAEDISNLAGSVEFSSDLRENHLRNLVGGHKVIGIALAPSSLYAEMALGAAKYLYERLQISQAELMVELNELTISSPLFLKDDMAEPQLVKIYATIESGSTTAKVIISSDKEHCRCHISFASGDWTHHWTRKRYLIDERVARLMSPVPERPTHHLLKEMIYKIFSPITEYTDEYQSISEVFIDSSFREAAIRLSLRQTPAGSKFAFDPCWLDSIAQVAGFVLNSNVSNPEDIIFMSTGWDTLRLSSALSGGKQYLCHVRAEEFNGGNSFLCDVIILDETSVVAVGEGLQFKRVRKALLRKLLELPTMGVDKHNMAPSQPKQKVVAKTRTNSPTSNSYREVKKAPVAAPLASSRNIRINPIELKAKIVAPKAASSGHVSEILELIGQEIGLSLNDVEDSMTLEDLGVDSLMTISITGQIKSKMHLELPASLIAGSTTIAELREYFGQDIAPLTESNKYDNLSTVDSLASSTRMTTPLSSSDYQEPTRQSDVMDAFLDAISSETGLSLEEIGEDTAFEDIGIDSLMSIAIIGVVKERAGIELPAKLFSDCDSVADVRKLLGQAEEVHGQ